MSISNALRFSPAGHGQHGVPHVTLPSLTERQEHSLLLSVMAVFFAGSAGVALYALSALGQ